MHDPLKYNADYLENICIVNHSIIKRGNCLGPELQAGHQQPARRPEHGQPLRQHIPQQNISVSPSPSPQGASC